MTKKTNNPWKVALISLVSVLAIAGISVAAYLLGKGNSLTQKSEATPGPTATTKPQEAVEPTVPPIELAENDPELIKQAIYELTGLDETNADITISENTGIHAKGLIKEHDAVSGAYWIAGNTPTGWIGVYAGQANPDCDEIDPYNFPISMVPECYDQDSGKVIAR